MRAQHHHTHSHRTSAAPAVKEKRGARYWFYTINELGQEDMEAQFGYIHQIKMAELHRGTRRSFALHLGQQANLDLADALHAPGGAALLRPHNRG